MRKSPVETRGIKMPIETPTENMKLAVVNAFFFDATEISEIAFRYSIPMRTVSEILEEEQRSKTRTVFSSKFKKSVAEFVHRNGANTSIANIARHFFLKDERAIRNWVVEYPATPKIDPQHSLLDPGCEWKAKYEALEKRYHILEDSLTKMRALAGDILQVGMR